MKHKERIRALALVLVAVALLFTISQFSQADSVDVLAGRSYKVSLEANAPSGRWAGVTISHNEVELDESNLPFGSIRFDTPEIEARQFPGKNLNDDIHYYAAMFDESFNLTRVHNVTVEDLDPNEMFDQTDFPDFYPDYLSYGDNPKRTFEGNTTDILLGGENFTAFVMTLAEDVTYYLLRYDEGSNKRPLFLTHLDYQTCYKGQECVGEFMLPVSPNEYNFYALNKYTSYDYRIWVDGVETNSFSQTALPYNLTVEVSNLYTSQLEPGVDVLVGEHNGQNIFIPYRMSGYISDSYTVGTADADAMETFLVAPTVYPSVDNYTIFVAVLKEGNLLSEEELYVNSKDTLVRFSKPLSPSTLYDNAKASVNAMSQIANSLFKWSSQFLSSKRFKISYDISSDSFTTYDYEISSYLPSPISLKTGAPNVIETSVTDGGTPQSDYMIRISEKDGYLIMNPYTESSPLSEKQRYHRQSVPVSQEFIITPTSLGKIDSNVTFEVLDYRGEIVAEKQFNVTSSLVYTGGVYFNNDQLKTIVNAMNQVLSSLYYSLNF
ncbi:MAG: hypothetical protein ACQESE_00275 [Nanobdellota archaeon]